MTKSTFYAISGCVLGASQAAGPCLYPQRAPPAPLGASVCKDCFLSVSCVRAPPPSPMKLSSFTPFNNPQKQVPLLRI